MGLSGLQTPNNQKPEGVWKQQQSQPGAFEAEEQKKTPTEVLLISWRDYW